MGSFRVRFRYRLSYSSVLDGYEMTDERPMTEQERDFRKAEREDLKLRDDMAELLRFKPFQVYCESLTRRIEELGMGLTEPLDEHPHAPARQEFVKGTLKGLLLARNLPTVIVQSMTGPPTESEDVADELEE
jgi:hypothetical protein